METKRCTKCGEVKGLEEFHRTSRTKSGAVAACKVCRLAHAKVYWEVQKKSISARTVARRANNIDLENKRKRDYYHKHRSKNLNRAKQRAKDLPDSYVLQLLKVPATPELIEMKRQQRLAHRALKEFQKLLKEQTK